jgi:hydrogenase maturation protein HypF
VPDVARAFHAGLALGIAEAAVRFANDYGVDVVALSGGVWQNALLCALAVPELQRRGLRVLTNRAVPPNDGGLSLGQAALATYALN